MWTLVKWEWVRQWGQLRFWAAIGTIGLLSGLVTYGYGRLKAENPIFDEVGRSGVTGYFVPILALMVSVGVILPFLVALWGGESIAGEKMNGTWQMLLAQGVDPWKLWLAKWVFVLQFSLGMTGFLVVTSLGAGVLVYGLHGILLPSGIRASSHTMMNLLLMMTGYTACGQIVVATIAVFFSTWMKHSLSSIMATMGSIITLSLLADWPLFSRLDPYLFTTYLSQVTAFLQFPPDLRIVYRGLVVYALYMVLIVAMLLWFEPFRD